VLADSVRERVVASDGWLSRCSGNQEFLKRDWEQIKDNFTYIVDTNDRAKALDVRARPDLGQPGPTRRRSPSTASRPSAEVRVS
jgi:hypothetical protein